MLGGHIGGEVALDQCLGGWTNGVLVFCCRISGGSIFCSRIGGGVALDRFWVAKSVVVRCLGGYGL